MGVASVNLGWLQGGWSIRQKVGIGIESELLEGISWRVGILPPLIVDVFSLLLLQLTVRPRQMRDMVKLHKCVRCRIPYIDNFTEGTTSALQGLSFLHSSHTEDFIHLTLQPSFLWDWERVEYRWLPFTLSDHAPFLLTV